MYKSVSKPYRHRFASQSNINSSSSTHVRLRSSMAPAIINRVSMMTLASCVAVCVIVYMIYTVTKKPAYPRERVHDPRPDTMFASVVEQLFCGRMKDQVKPTENPPTLLPIIFLMSLFFNFIGGALLINSWLKCKISFRTFIISQCCNTVLQFQGCSLR